LSTSLSGDHMLWEEESQIQTGSAAAFHGCLRFRAKRASMDRAVRRVRVWGVHFEAGGLELELARGRWEAQKQRLKGKGFKILHGPLELRGADLEVDLAKDLQVTVTGGAHLELSGNRARSSSAHGAPQEPDQGRITPSADR
jgi:hypothetical protein